MTSKWSSILRETAAESAQWLHDCLRDPTIHKGCVAMAAACLATALLSLQFAGDVLQGRELEGTRLHAEAEAKIGAEISADTDCKKTSAPVDCVVAQQRMKTLAASVRIVLQIFNTAMYAGLILLVLGCAGAVLAVRPSRKEAPE